MGFPQKVIVVLLSCFLGTAVLAAQDPVFYMCRNKKVVRTIQIKKNEGECATVYTKAGIDREMASGKNYESCVRVMTNIKENIEKAGWKCKAVEPAGTNET